MKLSSALLLPAAAVAFVGQAPAQKANVARSAVLERPAAAASPVLGFHVDGHAVVGLPAPLLSWASARVPAAISVDVDQAALDRVRAGLHDLVRCAG